MTDTYESDDNDQDEPTPRDLRHQLAEAKREAEQVRAELEATRREAEFTKALGSNAAAPWMPYFQKGYDGPIEADAIRQAATDAGFLTPVNQPTEQSMPADVAAHARMAAAATGSTSPAKIDWQTALAEADRITDQAQREAAILDVVERYGGTTSRTAQ